jgi:hypothetical protein
VAHRAILRHGLVLLMSQSPLVDLDGAYVRLRLSIWHRAPLRSQPATPWRIVPCIRALHSGAASASSNISAPKPDEDIHRMHCCRSTSVERVFSIFFTNGTRARWRLEMSHPMPKASKIGLARRAWNPAGSPSTMLPKNGCTASVRPSYRKYEKPLDLQYSMNLDSAPLGVVGRIVCEWVVPGG